MLTNMLRRIIKRIPFVEALRSFLEQWGLWAWVSAVIAAALSILYSVWAWISQSVPLWAAPLLSIAAICVAVVIFYHGLLTIQWWRAYRTDIPALGAQMIQFAQRFSRALNDYDRTYNHNRNYTHPQGDDALADVHREWQRNVEASRRKVGWISESFGGELIYYIKELHRLGIQTPYSITLRLDHTSFWLAAYLEYAGRMLKEGRIEELKKIDRDDDFRIGTMFS